MDISRSPHLDAPRHAERPTRWWIGAPLMVVIFIVAGGAVQGAITGIFGKVEEGSAWELVSEIPTFGVALLVMLAWVRFKDRRPATSIGFQWRSRPVLHVVVGLALGVVLLTIPTVLLLLTGQYASVEARASDTVGAGALVVVIPLILAVLVQSSTEEAMFRGYVQQLTGTQIKNGWIAVIVTSAAFALAHVDVHPLVLANIILVAVVFSFIALRIGTIWLVCGMHGGWNWAQGNLFGIPVSGNPVDVSVFRVSPTSDAAFWITGGDFGVEGSAITTLVLALAAFAAYRFWMAGPAARPQAPTVVEPAAA